MINSVAKHNHVNQISLKLRMADLLFLYLRFEACQDRVRQALRHESETDCDSCYQVADGLVC